MNNEIHMVYVSSTFRKSSWQKLTVLFLFFLCPALVAEPAQAAVSMQTGDSTVLEIQDPPQADPYGIQPQGQSPAGAGTEQPFGYDQEGGASLMRTIPKPADPNNAGGYPYGGPVYVSPEIYVQPQWGGQGFPGWRPGQGSGWQHGQGSGWQHGKPGSGMHPGKPGQGMGPGSGMNPGKPGYPGQGMHPGKPGYPGQGMHPGKPGQGIRPGQGMRPGKPGYPGHGMGQGGSGMHPGPVHPGQFRPGQGKPHGGGWKGGHGPAMRPGSGGMPPSGGGNTRP